MVAPKSMEKEGQEVLQTSAVKRGPTPEIHQVHISLPELPSSQAAA